MKNKKQKGFTLIEMVLVIVAVGIIGSMAATMLFQGADVFVSETNRQGFVSANRSAFWKLMRETQGQNSPNDFTLSDHNSLYLRNGSGTQKEYQTSSPGTFNYSYCTESLIDNGFSPLFPVSMRVARACSFESTKTFHPDLDSP